MEKIMKNPWEGVLLADYEEHMKLPGIHQLQSLNFVMKRQIAAYPVRTLSIITLFSVIFRNFQIALCISKEELTFKLKSINMDLIYQDEIRLPNKKALLRLDYKKAG